MDKLSMQSYAGKCILGMEVAHVICLALRYVPFRTARGIEMHHALFEALPGFVWGNFGSIIWGAALLGIIAAIVGSYIA